MSGFKLKRLGMVMEPEQGNPQEIEGILNPAAARGPDRELYIFPRMVAKGIIRALALRGCDSTKQAIR
jgi:beta-1,2-mannobiose phosphorylase / 1,2-beta-oligomannan phosphorylase